MQNSFHVLSQDFLKSFFLSVSLTAIYFLLLEKDSKSRALKSCANYLSAFSSSCRLEYRNTTIWGKYYLKTELKFVSSERSCSPCDFHCKAIILLLDKKKKSFLPQKEIEACLHIFAVFVKIL